MKRLLVRFSLLSVLVAVGVFAIVQAQREQRQDPNASEPDAPPAMAPQVPLLAPPEIAADEIITQPLAVSGEGGPKPSNPASELIPLPAHLADAQANDAFVMPAPSETIVRGNDGAIDDSGDEPQQPAVVASDPNPAANLLAQAGGARAANPFARRALAAQPAQPEVQEAAGEPENDAETSEQQDEAGAFAVGPTLASPAAAPSDAEYSQSGGDAGASRFATQSAASEYTVSGGGYSAAESNAAAPAPALGAPRELPTFGARGNQPAAMPTPTIANPPGEPQAGGVSQFSDGGDEPSSSRLVQPGLDRQPGASAGSNYAGARNPPSGVEGIGTPGPQGLEGPQTPSVTLKKIAPPEIQIGKPATFEIHVQNVGRIAAHQVIVKEDIPRGVQLIDTAPPATPSGSSLVWELGTLQPGDSRQIKINYLPMAEGDIGSVAVAAFQAQASVRTVCTRPLLVVEQAAPEKVLVGQTFTVRIRLSNPGTGVASKVVLEEDVPEGFSHPSGKALEYEVGSLRPGETRDLDLTLQAARPGVWDNALVVRGEGNLAVEKSVKVEVVAPALDLAMAGPTRRYLERQATYAVSIANPGTATAQDVRIVGRLPKGMKFVAANNEGQYDPKTHAVVWALAELPPGQRGEVQLTALPVETGEQKIVVEGKGDLEIAAQAEHAVSVEALAELAFEIADKADPIEVNKETIYEVKVTNKGSKTATNIRLSAVFPPDMKPLAGDGPARAEVAEGRVIFEPLARLNPREEAVFRIQAQGLRAGDQRIQVQIVSDDSPTPVTKEESTRVYTDR